MQSRQEVDAAGRVVVLGRGRREETAVNYSGEYEQEIDLRDLLFHILYRWRSIVLTGVLICGLAIGYAFVGNEGKFFGEAQIGQADGAEGTEGAADANAADKADPVKYGVIGFAGGILLLIFLYAAGYVFSDKIRGERELRERYGYNLLGTLPKIRKRVFLPGIDRMLEKLEGSAEPITEEEAYWIIAINIINLAKTGGTFLVTGTVALEKLQEITEVLSAQVENVTLMSCANMNRTASTLEALAECDAVILVEERGRSLRREIHREHESIAALEKVVVGYVAV